MSGVFSEATYAVHGVLGTTSAWTSLAATGPGPAGEARWYVIVAPHASLFTTPEVVHGFVLEAQRLARLEHDGIAGVVDHGIDPELGPYLVRPFVAGETLAALIARLAQLGRLVTPELGASLGALIADALEHCAKWWSPSSPDVGVFHGALDARAVLLGSSGAVKLLNVGLERALRYDRLRRARVPEDVTMLSPDRARGQGPTIQGDLYALGTTLWEATTGQPLIRGSGPQQVLQALVSGTGPSVHEPQNRAASEDLPSEFLAVIERLVTQQSELRFASASDVARELRRFAASRGAFLSANDLARIVRESFPDRASNEPRILAPWHGPRNIQPTGRPSVLPPPRPDGYEPRASSARQSTPLSGNAQSPYAVVLNPGASTSGLPYPSRAPSSATGPASAMVSSGAGPPTPSAPAAPRYRPSVTPFPIALPPALTPGGTPARPFSSQPGRTPSGLFGHWSDGSPMTGSPDTAPSNPWREGAPSLAPRPVDPPRRAFDGGQPMGGDDPRGTPLPQLLGSVGDSAPGPSLGSWSDGTPAALEPINPLATTSARRADAQQVVGVTTHPASLVSRSESVGARSTWGDMQRESSEEDGVAAVYRRPTIPVRSDEPLVIPPSTPVGAPPRGASQGPPARSPLWLVAVGLGLMGIAAALVWAADRAQQQQAPAFIAPLEGDPRTPSANPSAARVEVTETSSASMGGQAAAGSGAGVGLPPTVGLQADASVAAVAPSAPTPATRVAAHPQLAPVAARPAPSPTPAEDEGELDLGASLLEDASTALQRGDAKGAEKLAADCLQYRGSTRCLRVLAEAQAALGQRRLARASYERYLAEPLPAAERQEVVRRLEALDGPTPR